MIDNKGNYQIQGRTVSIKATSRVSLKLKDNFYTVEYSEERIIPDSDDIDIQEERDALWDTVNDECDNQAAEIKKTFS